MEKQIERLKEEVRELRGICQRQRDSLAAQQEAIVQLNVSTDSTLACLAEKYGVVVKAEDGTEHRRLTIPTEAYPGVLDRCEVHAAIADGQYIITCQKKET